MGLAIEATRGRSDARRDRRDRRRAGRGTAWYLPFRHHRPGVLDLDGVQVRNLPALDAPAMQAFAALLEDEDVACTGHDLKDALLLLRRAGITLRGLAFDTQVASYVVDPGRRDHELTSLALQRFGHRRRGRDEIAGKGRTQVPIAEVEVETVRDWVGEAADLSLRLRETFEPELAAAQLEPLFQDIEMPLLPVLADMEYAGIRIDAGFFRTQSVKLGARSADDRGRDLEGGRRRSSTSNSTPQLRTILFEKLDLPDRRKTKTGAFTDAAVLEELAAAGHTLPRLILEYRPARQAAEHLRGRAARAGEPGDGPHPHALQPDRRGDGPALLERPEPPEHPDPHGPGRGAAEGRSSRPTAACSWARTTRRSSCACSRTCRATR